MIFQIRMNHFGYTLIETIAVVVILASTASFAIVKYTHYLQSIKNQEAEHVLIALLGAQLDYKRENGNFLQGDQNQINTSLNINLSSGLKNFKSLTANNNVPYCGVSTVAQVTANNDEYVLGISILGDIKCFSTDGACGIDMCLRMGYR